MNKTIQKTNFIQKYLPTILVIGILTIITVGFRLYKIQTPLVEYHSWRQADTLAVARNYVRNGINLLLPKYDDISKLQSGLENPQGYRMVEFPIYNAIIALFSMFVPGIPIEQVGRMVSILCSLVTVFLIYQLVLETKNKMAAWFAAIIFAVFPFFVFYTRAVLPENLAVTLIMLSVFFCH
ncbi:MAG: glycosyltransferase family 39 protein [Patescibacteria group bacterium]